MLKLPRMEMARGGKTGWEKTRGNYWERKDRRGKIPVTVFQLPDLPQNCTVFGADGLDSIHVSAKIFFADAYWRRNDLASKFWRRYI